MSEIIDNKLKIIDVLTRLGGMGTLNNIYDHVETYYPNTIARYKDIVSYKAAIRDCLESHSSDSEKFRGTKEDCFYIVFNKGDGVWGIRNHFNNDLEHEDTEKVGLSKHRTKQGKFRSLLLKCYGEKCPFTDIDILSFLVASHIKPWSTDEASRLNPNNGILLSLHLDKLFDSGLISISKDGLLLYKNDKVKELVSQNFTLKREYLDKEYLTQERLEFLAWHRMHHNYRD